MSKSEPAAPCDPGRHDATSPRSRRSASGCSTSQEPNDVNQRRAPARSSVGCLAREHGAVAPLEDLDDLVERGAVEGLPGGDQDVEEAVVLEAVVAGVAYGVVQPGRALERRLAIERRVDPPRQRVRRGEGGGLEAAGAELQPQLGLGDHVGGREPAGRRPDVRGARRRPARGRRADPRRWRRRRRQPRDGRCRPGRPGRAGRSRALRARRAACEPVRQDRRSGRRRRSPPRTARGASP